MSVYNTYLKQNYEPIIPETAKENIAETTEEKPASETIPAESKGKKAKKG